MQTIVYDSRIKCFVFYRGGYDETTKKGIDPYKREFEPLTKERGYNPFYHGVADGLLLHALSIYSKNAVKFFFNEDFLSGTRVVNGNWKVCFDNGGRLVFYRAQSPDPVRVTKVLKTESKFYKEWTTASTHPYNDPWPREVKGWKFKKGVEYAIVDINMDYLFQLLPVEYEKLGFGKKSLFGHEEWLKRNDTLYAIDPIDLNASWDRTDDEKSVIKTEIDKIRAEKRAAQEDLERRRHTPGFCSVCGREGAEYVADPYAEEMYGEIHMEWLCPDCYHDAAMDV
jgi:hypothetical protein